jgi:hypothetical protein
MALTAEQRKGYGDEYIKQAFQKFFKRDPTATEIAMVFPTLGNDPNVHDIPGMESYVASLYQAQKGPEDERAKLDEKIPQYSGDIQSIFSDLVKRGASADEIQHFGREMAAGNLDAYTLRQFVQSMPEYQTSQDKSFREGLSGELQGYDKKFFDTGKEDIISRYASMGRQGSSALDYALTDMLGKIADKRGEWLANLSATQYGGNKENARSDYEASVNRMIGDEAYSRAQKDALMQRGWNIQDYNTQSSDYDRWMASQKRNPGMGAASGALAGGSAMAATGNPWAIGAGALGGGLFGYYGSR